MSGAMRKMGIYLGLVEDDDARAYGRYDAHPGDADHYDRHEERRYSRYAPEDSYADRYDAGDRYDPADYRADGYRDSDYRGEGHFADVDTDLPPAPDPEPLALPRRPAANRNLGLAPAPGGATSTIFGTTLDETSPRPMSFPAPRRISSRRALIAASLSSTSRSS